MKRKLNGALCACLALVLLQACGKRDWSETTAADVEHIYVTLRDNHPGPVDPQNPGFAPMLESQYASALGRAAQVQTEAGYFYTLRGMTVPFQDNHLGVGLYRQIERDQFEPGFVVSGSGVEDVTVVRRDRDSAPPLGARLLSCDGQPVDEMVATRLAPFIGNWSVSSARPGDLPYLLIDSGNPFVPRPAECRFESGDDELVISLDWMPLAPDYTDGLVDMFEPRISNPVAMTWLDDMLWISVGSLDVSNPETASAFDQLLEELAAHRDRLAGAGRIVVDLRGNTGGSSAPGIALAGALFGAGYVDHVRPRIERVDWRASSGNLAKVDTYLPMMESALGADSPTVTQMKAIRAGLVSAVAADEPYFSQQQGPRSSADAPPPAQILPPVFVLTDRRCVSACLDLVDVLLATGQVTQVGQPTSADTRYLEVVTEDLPSGIAQLAYPTAVHRGRERADNAVYVPTAWFAGDLRDTEALQAWVRSL